VWNPIPAYTYLLLLLSLPLSAVIFSQMPPVRAALVVILGGTMFLPELAAFDPPLLPPMDKHTFVFAAAFVGMTLRAPKLIKAAKPGRGVDLWFLLFLIGAIGTARTNVDGFVYGGGLHWNEVDHFPTVVIPPLRMYDAISVFVGDLTSFWLPFFMGRAVISDRDDLDLFLRALAFCGLVYVPFMCVEMVVSPQLHNWLYGYHPASFAHAMRGSGFKPMVFLKGGLAVAMFQYAALVCAIICHRTKKMLPYKIKPGLAVWAIVLSLVFSRNVGVLFYVVGTLPIMMMLGSASQLRAALVLVMMFISFPYTRATDIFPAEDLLATAQKYSHKRYESLKTRFDNEDVLLERAMLRPTFGWGYYGRNRIYDKRTGMDISITDGEWVTHLGSRGYIMEIGWAAVLVWPVLMAWKGIKKVASKPEKLILGVLALGLAMFAVDMLPNSSFNRILYFFSGAVVGALRVLKTAPTDGASNSGGHAVVPNPRVGSGGYSAGHPAAGYPAAGHPAAGYPGAGHGAPVHPSAGHPSAGHPAAGHPAAAPNAGYASPGQAAAGPPGAYPGQPSGYPPSG